MAMTNENLTLRLRDMADTIGSRHPDEAARIMQEAADRIVGVEAESEEDRGELRRLLKGYRDMRAERDALQRRIDEAPKRVAYRGNDSHACVLHAALPLSWKGRRVALVVLP